ncbi:MAG: hypothetical protein AAF205_06715, partial [Pseudomonadota bacterium]
GALVDAANELAATVAGGIAALEENACRHREGSAALVETIADHGGAASEMNSAMHAAAQASRAVTGAAERVTVIAGETRTMSSALLSAAGTVTETGAAFRGIYERFTEKIRAA